MNVKLHTPKTLKAGSGMSSAKQFLLSLIATTVSIVLTFGTAAIIDNHKKKAARKEMVMMVISDFDKTIEMVQKADSALREAKRIEMALAAHPEHYDSLSYALPPLMAWVYDEFPATVEKIFSTSIETFNTIGDVNFVNEASSFYMARSLYKTEVQDRLKENLMNEPVLQSIQSLMNVNFPNYVYENWVFLQNLKNIRDRCAELMKVNEQELSKFTKRQHYEDTSPEKEALSIEMINELDSCNSVIQQAKKRFKD